MSESAIIVNKDFQAFPKIYHIGDKAIPYLFKGPVEVTEKIDGSQFSFMKTREGILKMRSKGREITTPDKLFAPACAYVASISDRLTVNCQYFGETLSTPHHNVIKYERTPHNSIVLFGIYGPLSYLTPNEGWYSHGEVSLEATRLGLDVVPLLCYNEINSIDELLSLLDKMSYLGGEKVEGFVVKNFNQYSMNPHSLGCFGKYVREGFKERNSGTKTKTNQNNGIDGLVAEITTEARWSKALQHLRDDGKLSTTPADIGPIIQEVIKDIETEEREFIKDRLYTIFRKFVLGGATKGLPEWYKKKLVGESFK